MAERKVGLKAKAAMGVAALTLFFAQVACGGASKIDPCDEVFHAIARAYFDIPGAVDDNVIHFWPADKSGIQTHPEVNWQNGRTSWRDAVSFIRFNCPEYEVESLAVNQNENFYDEGVNVRKKLQQNFSLPEQGVNWVNGVLVAAAAVLGISALLGTKKLVTA